jgi:DNA-binding transcriptional MerR regulator
MEYYTAKEIADILAMEGDTEMTLRKVRYYTQIGMLPALPIINNKPKYTAVHLEHLRALRTMQRTGEKLDDIKEKLSDLDEHLVSNIGQQMNYYTSDRLIDSTTVQVNPEISITFNNSIPQSTQDSIVKMIKDRAKHESNNGR